jgi:hypothetical protein
MAAGKASRPVRKALKASLALKSAVISADVKKTRAAGAKTVNPKQGEALKNLDETRGISRKKGVSAGASFRAIEKGRKAADKPGGVDKLFAKSYKANGKAIDSNKKAAVKAQLKAAKTYTKPYNAKKGK